MGFHAELRFVHQVEILWSEFQRLDLGRVTRLEKIIDPHYNHIRRTDFQRVGICLTSILLANLFKENAASSWAPEFYTGEEVPSGEHVCLHEDWYYPGSSFVRKCKEHNALLPQHTTSVERDTYAGSVSLLGPPFLWAPCFEIAKWLAEPRSEWEHLKAHETAFELAKTYRDYIVGLSKIGAKAVFLFS